MTITTGTERDDVLSGDKTDENGQPVYTDTIYGLGGDDIIDPGRGNDFVYGGDGDDLIYSHHTLEPGGGNVPSAASGTGHLFGEAGDDTFVVYSQGGILDGGDGSDTVVIAPAEALYITAQLGDGEVAAHEAPGGVSPNQFLLYAQLISVENIVGSGFDETFTGSAASNRMVGAAGDDQLYGMAGDDILLPGIGVDIVDGGTGNDTVDFTGDTGVVASLALDGQRQIQAMSSGFVTAAFTLTSIENIRGSGFNDSLTGTTGNNRIDGSGGDDTLTGNGGQDVFAFDWANQGNDTITDFSLADDRFDLDLATFTDVREQNGDTIITYSGGTITVKGITGLDLFAWRALILDETVRLGSGNNTATGTSGRDSIEGGGGNDVIDGGKGDDMLFGEANAYYYVNGMVTPFGNDTLYGGKGNDLLAGGRGDDQLFGGDGDDRLVNGEFYNGAHAFGSSGFGGAIADVDGGNDILDGGAGYDDAILAFYGRVQGISLDHSGNDAFAQIYSGGIAAGSIVGVENVFLIGGEGADTFIAGTSPNGDTFFGNGGDDIFYASAGSEWYIGGDGNDTISYERGSAGVTINLIAATNAVDTKGSGFDRIQQVENVIGTAFADSLTGDAGANRLDGGAGLDRLYGGGGNDIYFTDQQGDLVFENAGEGTDGVISTANFYLYANVENLTLAGSAAIFGVGNELANTITGNGAANTLLAGAGVDVVHGGAGADIIYGQDGNDQLFGDADNDYLAGGLGDDVMDGGTGGDSLYGEDGNDTLTGGTDFVFDQLVGGNGNDILHGDSGLADYDYLYGNAGDDSFYVDTGDDLTFEQAGEGIDTVYATVPGSNNGVYLYANIENLVLLGTTSFGVGNVLANVMTGNASGNTLLGGDGNDRLNGKAGNDVLFGQAGGDTFVFEHGTGGDVIGDFVPGTDKIDLTAIGYTWQQVQNSFHQNGGNTAIDLGGGDLVVLNGVTAAQLSASDFILASSGAAIEPVASAGYIADASDDGAPTPIWTLIDPVSAFQLLL